MRTGKISKKVRLWGAAGILCVCGLLAALLLYNRSADEVAIIDGQAITGKELSFHMSRLQPAVQNEFLTRYQVTLGKKDWNRDFAGITPLDELRKKALAESLADKAVFLLAQREGLIDSANFSDLSKAMDRENQSRKEAIAKGEVVYGLEQFTLEEYYSHVLSALKTELKKKLSQSANDPLYIEGGDVAKYFQANKAEWRVNATSYQVTRLDIPADPSIQAAVETAIRKRMRTNPGLEALQSQYSGSKLSVENLTAANSANLNSYDAKIMRMLQDLAEGEISDPVETGRGVSVYRLDKIVFDEKKALSEYSNQIKQQMLDEKFKAYMESYQKSLPVKVNQKKVGGEGEL